MRECRSLESIAQWAAWRLGDVQKLAEKLGVPIIVQLDGIEAREYVTMKHAAVIKGAIDAAKRRTSGWRESKPLPWRRPRGR